MFRAFSRHVSNSLSILRWLVFVEGDFFNDKFYTMQFTLNELHGMTIL